MPDFSIIRGNDDTLEATIYEADGVTPRDITGADIRFTAKRHPDYNASIIAKSINEGVVITGGPAGEIEIELARADTVGLPADVDLYYDVQVTKDGDTDTPITGKLHVAHDVTR